MLLRSNIYSIFWAILIFALSLVSGKQLPGSTFVSFDKILHATMYAIQAFLLYYGLKKQYSLPKVRSKATLWTIGICTLYGLFIEYLQPVISDRHAEFYDFLANFIGCVLGTFTFKLIYRV